MDIVVGFSSVCASLRSDASVENDEVDVDDELTLEGAEEWTSDITLSDTDSWTNTGILGSEHRRTNCTAINYSSGGYCLSIDAKERFYLRVGELALVRESSNDAWRPAVISWVSSCKDRMDFGVKLLAEIVQACSLRSIYDNSIDGSTDCLLLSNLAGTSPECRVITASPDFAQGDTFMLKTSDNESKLVVSHIETKSSGYTEYRCARLGMPSDVADNTATTTKADQTKHPETEVELEVNFDSLWSEL